MKRRPPLFVLIIPMLVTPLLITPLLLMATALVLFPLRAEVDERDVGIPLYPGSRQVPDSSPPETDKNLRSFMNINLLSSDGFTKVLTYYQEKLGKFSIFRSQTAAKSALWNESTAKGYRIITLVETDDGTRITITRRVW